MAKVSSSTELPRWFNLQKYEDSEKLDAAGWFIQLSLRKELHDFYKYLIEKKQTESEFFKDGQMAYRIHREDLDRLRSQPIQPTDSDESLDMFWSASNYRKDLAISPVRGLSFQDLTAQRLVDEFEVSEGNFDALQLTRWSLLLSKELGDCPVEPVQVGRVRKNGIAALIDLNASNSVLEKAFRAWLLEARAAEAVLEQKNSKLCNRWARYGLLPYLDLQIWEMETNSKISPDLMSQAIVKHHATEDRDRRTIAPIAKKLMSDLSELQALAATNQPPSRGTKEPE